jgi:hypothetical protein
MVPHRQSAIVFPQFLIAAVGGNFKDLVVIFYHLQFRWAFGLSVGRWLAE